MVYLEICVLQGTDQITRASTKIGDCGVAAAWTAASVGSSATKPSVVYLIRRCYAVQGTVYHFDVLYGH